jgi:hypothetical protein
MSPDGHAYRQAHIRTRQREIPDQVIPTDVGERPQPLQLILNFSRTTGTPVAGEAGGQYADNSKKR